MRSLGGSHWRLFTTHGRVNRVLEGVLLARGGTPPWLTTERQATIDHGVFEGANRKDSGDEDLDIKG